MYVVRNFKKKKANLAYWNAVCITSVCEFLKIKPATLIYIIGHSRFCFL